jgi:hypothetical protein
VQSYRSVVERTREFVENLKALRALGLDPQLFNQLVQAGVEAGGATAQALVEGGTDTITEINGLFAELNSLGTQLGENTAQVMYGQGEKFVDGIVRGLESQLGELESMANSLAESFTTTFEEVLIAGIERAIAAAEAALSRMPQVPGFSLQSRDDGVVSGGVTAGSTAGTGSRPPLLSAGANAGTSRPSLFQLGQIVSGSSGGMNIGATISGMQSYNPLRDAGSNAYTGLSRTPAAQITIQPSSSARMVANAVTQSSTRSSTSYLTSRSALNARVGG